MFLIQPNHTPNPDLYIAWADTINLSDPRICLLGPFDFSDPSSNPPDCSPTH